METKQLSQKPLTFDLAKKLDSSKYIKISLKNSRAKIEYKDGNHKVGRMKVTLKFAKDEAEGFNNFCKLAKPDNISMDDFAKFLFYKGVESLQKDFAARLEQYKQENPDEFARIKSEFEQQQQSQQEGSITVADEIPKL